MKSPTFNNHHLLSEFLRAESVIRQIGLQDLDKRQTFWDRQTNLQRRGLESRMLELATLTYALAQIEGDAALAEAVNLRRSDLETSTLPWIKSAAKKLISASCSLLGRLPDDRPLLQRQKRVQRAMARYLSANRNRKRSLHALRSILAAFCMGDNPIQPA